MAQSEPFYSTRVRAHTRTRIRVRTHAYARARARTRTHARARVRARARIVDRRSYICCRYYTVCYPVSIDRKATRNKYLPIASVISVGKYLTGHIRTA